MGRDSSLIRTLLSRLEHLNVDSRLAHRASGIRRGLLGILQDWEEGRPVDPLRLKDHIQASLDLLNRAGRERLRTRLPGSEP